LNADLPEILTPRLCLRIAGPELAQRTVDFSTRNREFLTPWEPAFTPKSFDAAAVRRIGERAVADARTGLAFAFAIFPGSYGDDVPVVGYLTFSNVIRGIFHACIMGYKLDRGMQGQGFMTEAAAAGIEYMFSVQRMHRVAANYMPHNQRSAAVLRRLGFRVEGNAKDYLYIAGAWRDHVLTALVNPDPIVP
jgi:ribosomal-protein-alanine N-acetyltransferase